MKRASPNPSLPRSRREPRLHFAVALAGVLFTLLWIGCDTDFEVAGPVERCTEAGIQCQLADGPLGVCERSLCPEGASQPCFQCVSQH